MAPNEPDDMMTPDAPATHRAPSAATYLIVWIALVVLATVTLFASRAVTGGWGLVVAFVIASAKAGLVIAYFMHLAGGRPIHRIVFVTAMAFLVLLVIGILSDVGTRSIAGPYVDDIGGPP
jgi:cytochrome c oxidase subunit 4